VIPQEYYTTFLPIKKEDEQKYIAYLFNNPESVNTITEEGIYDDTCKKLYLCIKNIIENKLKVELDIFCDYAKKVGIEKTTVVAIVNAHTDFTNIEQHTIKNIRDYHNQRQIVQDVDSVIAKAIVPSSKGIDFEAIKQIADKIQNKTYELGDESRLLSTKDLGAKYRNIIIKRKNPNYRRTLGFPQLDRIVSKPAEPEELTIIFGNKNSGKSLFCKTLENNLINQGICVVSFNMEMSSSSNMDRLVSMREEIPFKIITHKVEPSQKDYERIETGIKNIEQIPNYFYCEEPTITLKDFDELLYLAKKKFKQNGVLPDDSYTVAVVDLGSMIKEFSGKEAYGLQEAVDKLSVIYRSHYNHTIFVLQSNESQVRGGKRFASPEQCDNFALQYEDIFGGSAYAARARVILSVNRPLLLKRRFMPHRQEEWDLEEDIMWINLAKDNDNDDGKLGSVPFVFPNSAFKIIPKESKLQQTIEPEQINIRKRVRN
jgi:hypothetical protein